jgi:hypothetical protein
MDDALISRAKLSLAQFADPAFLNLTFPPNFCDTQKRRTGATTSRLD